jgi:hypothetical protein
MAGIAAGGEVKREPAAKNVGRRRAARIFAAARYKTALAFCFRGVVINGYSFCA